MERVYLDSCIVIYLVQAPAEIRRKVRAGHGLRTPDALHVAAALASGCTEIWTNDRRLPGDLEPRIRIRALP